MDQRAALTADRAELRALVDSYARGVDKREIEAMTQLFHPEAVIVVASPGSSEPSAVHHGRAAILDAMDANRSNLCTTHLIGAHAVRLQGDEATGETTCIGHHIYERDGERRIEAIGLSYYDRYVRHDGSWKFLERRLVMDWSDDRPLVARGAEVETRHQ
jgi:uncharacterized protein (TIGR02246 family)